MPIIKIALLTRQLPFSALHFGRFIFVSQEKYLVEMYFPRESLAESPFAGRKWKQVRPELMELLQSAPELVSVLHLTDGKGAWHSDQGWLPDKVCRISILVSPSFVSEYATGVSTPARQYVARIAQLSCVRMGHEEFWFVRDNRSLDVWTKEGVEIAERLHSYDEILGE